MKLNNARARRVFMTAPLLGIEAFAMSFWARIGLWVHLSREGMAPASFDWHRPTIEDRDPFRVQRFSNALPSATPAVRTRLTPPEERFSGRRPGGSRVPSARVHGQNTDREASQDLC